MKPIQLLSQEATTRYLTDPSFHARVLFAVAATEATADMMGVTLDKQTRDGLLQACVYGLLMADYDVADLGIDAERTVNSMKQTAESMGMQVVARPAIEMNFEATADPEIARPGIDLRYL